MYETWSYCTNIYIYIYSTNKILYNVSIYITPYMIVYINRSYLFYAGYLDDFVYFLFEVISGIKGSCHPVRFVACYVSLRPHVFSNV